ncbi:MAG: TIR domain-containing protein [Synechococcaceae cyanobacterium]
MLSFWSVAFILFNHLREAWVVAQVFVSHSSRDAAPARWIADWLVAQGFVAPFLDFDKHSGIPPGADWEQTLYKAISRSQALVIVQSRNWNDSKWCFAEFTQARALGKPIFQLLGVPPDLCDSPDLAPISADLQQLDLRKDRDTALASLAKALSELALNDRDGFAWDSSRPPYPGLLAFDADDAAVFFGREPEVRELIERLQVLRIQGGERLLVLLGASGAGKSSLLRAGALPRLVRSGNSWIPLAPIRPQANPCLSLSTALAASLRDGRTPGQIEQLLLDAAFTGNLSSALDTLVAEIRNAHHAPDAVILISIDQGEELFTLTEPQKLRLFTAILNATLGHGSSILVVLTLRSDYLEQLQTMEGLSVALSGMPLSPMPRERLADVIKGPAQVAGLRVGESFVQAVIEDAATTDALPLLAFALREIYDQRAADGILTLDDYRHLGNQRLSPLENSVRQAAETVFTMAAPNQEQIEALRESFVSGMVGVNEAGDFVRKPVAWDTLPPLAEPLLTRLVQARLLTVFQRDNQRWLEVAHEALLRNWPMLRQWLDDCRDILVGTRQLEGDLKAWASADAPLKDAALLSGLKLIRAEEWLQQQPRHFSSQMKLFVEASVARRDLLSRRRQRNQLIVLLSLGSLTVLATAAWLWGELKARAAYNADTLQLKSTHLLLVDADPKRSVLYGLAAMHRLQGSISEALPLALSLDRAASNTMLKTLFPSHQGEVWSLAEAPDGRIMSGSKEGTVRIFSSQGKAIGEAITTPHRSGVRGLVVIDADHWWSAGDDGSLQLWKNRQKLGHPISSGHGSIQAMVRDRQGDLITGGTDGLLRRWRSSDGTPLAAPIVTKHQEVWSIAVLDNGDWVTGGREGVLRWWHNGRPHGAAVASGQGAISALLPIANNGVLAGGGDGNVSAWNSNRRRVEKIRSGHSSVLALLGTRKGFILSGGSESNETNGTNFIHVWDPKYHNNSQSLRVPVIQYLSVVELCNGDLMTGANDGSLQYWRGNRPVGKPIQTGHGSIFALARTRHGDILSGGRDGTIGLWQNGQLIRSFSTGQQGIYALLALQDGTILSGGNDGTIRQWREDGREVEAAIRHANYGKVWALASLSNGDLLSGGDGGTIRRWRHGRTIATYQTPHNTVISLVVRRNGEWLSAGSGGELQVWAHGKPIGPSFLTGYGSLWMLIERRNGHLASANGDGTVVTYPTPAEAIRHGCSVLHGIPQITSITVDNSPINNLNKDVRSLCFR